LDGKPAQAIHEGKDTIDRIERDSEAADQEAPIALSLETVDRKTQPFKAHCSKTAR
jgi:hypothetical protein